MSRCGYHPCREPAVGWWVLTTSAAERLLLDPEADTPIPLCDWHSQLAGRRRSTPRLVGTVNDA